MDLSLFKALVDACPTPSSADLAKLKANESLAEIRGCFRVEDSDKARMEVRGLIADLGFRFMCDQSSPDPYRDVAFALQDALKERGHSAEQTSNWTYAVQLAFTHAARFRTGLPADQQWIADTRVTSLSKAIRSLRGLGYRIDLPASGGVNVPDSEVQRLADEIAGLSASLGRALAWSAAGAMGPHYSKMTGRFRLGRVGQTIQIDAPPERPLAYLYQLGLRYFAHQPTASKPEETLARLVDLVTWATALLDLSVSTFELIFARPSDIVGIMQKSAVYDSVFLVAQAKPSHAREYIQWIMSQEALAKLEDKRGRTADQILAVALKMLRACERVAPHDFSLFAVQDAAFASNLDLKPAAELLREVFCHPKDVNRKLGYPPSDNDIDAAFRPLIADDQAFVMQPPPMASRAIANAALDWCKKNWPNKRFDDEAMGPLFERFVRAKMEEHGVNVLHGEYKAGQSSGECDAVVETATLVCFFELKSKMFTRAARAGNDVTALGDLAQALVRPQAQAMERHAVLQEHGAISLEGDSSNSTIELNGREVLKVSITRGELGSLHDRPFLQHFLRAGCISTFNTLDPEQQSKLNDLHVWFEKLRGAAMRAGDGDFYGKTPFSKSWSISVYQLLLLLERTVDNETLGQEFLRTRQMITPTRDFYTEYEYKLQLDQFKEANQ